jgi:hypothetical protein
MHRLESVLEQGLRSVTAPPELWDRLQGAPIPHPRSTHRGLVWAMAATVVLAAVALSLVRPRDEAAAVQQSMVFRCQNPAQLRAWVRARTGIDVPLRDTAAESIQLIGANAAAGRVEIAYRAGNRDAVLVVSRTDSGSVNVAHNRPTGNVSWVMDGERFTLACNNAADLQLACKLCHLD